MSKKNKKKQKQNTIYPECDCCGTTDLGGAEHTRLCKVGRHSLCKKCSEFLVQIRDEYGLLGLDKGVEK